MSSSAQLLSILAAGVLAYAWVSTPALHPYSLQLTAALVLLYMIIKRLAKAKIHHIMPTALTFETAILATAILIIVGTTGGTTSLLLPLLNFLLFLSTFTLDVPAVVALGLMFPLFLWTITPLPLNIHQVATLITFPILLPFLIIAKIQHDEARAERKTLVVREGQAHDIELFLTTVLKPKLYALFQLSAYPEENKANMQKQVRGLIEETELLTEEMEDV